MLIFKMVLILIKNKSLDPYSALFLDTPYILETLSFVLKGSIQRILQELLQEYIPPLRIVLFRIPLDLLQEYILPLYSKGIVFKGFLWSCYKNISYLCTPREQYSKDSSGAITRIYPTFVLQGNSFQRIPLLQKYILPLYSQGIEFKIPLELLQEYM